MVNTAFHTLSVPFAIITGTGAGILALQSRNILRESPFEKSIISLTLVMSILTGYHGILFAIKTETLVLQLIRVTTFLAILISVYYIIKADRGIRELSRRKHQSQVEYRKILFLSIIGLCLYILGGPLSKLLMPSLLHWIHGFATLLIVIGLYNITSGNFQKGRWTEALLSDPSVIRKPSDWMRPIDDPILEVFRSSDLVLTPAIIAFNIGYSREEVNRRLSKLESHGLIRKIERGKYQITPQGKRYLQGFPATA